MPKPKILTTEKPAPFYVTLNRDRIPIDREVFMGLMNASVSGTYQGYESALDKGRISLKDLQDLSRKGKVPWTLFFAPLDFVKNQIERNHYELLKGFSEPETVRINSREEVTLNKIDLTLKDLMRKQQALRKLDKTLTSNPVMGTLGNPNKTAQQEAETLTEVLGFDINTFHSIDTKEQALEYMIDVLGDRQILVSRSVQRDFMPQRIDHASFSGLTIKDNKVPYIFLASEGRKDAEPIGRRIFTLTLLTVLVASRVFAPVAWQDTGRNQSSTSTEHSRAYDIAGEFLMPARILSSLRISNMEELRSHASRFHVTPSALAVRAAKSGVISWEMASTFLQGLREEFISHPAEILARRPRPEKSVAKYASPEFVRRMLTAHDSGKLNAKDFCLTVTFNKLSPKEIPNLRRVVH